MAYREDLLEHLIQYKRQHLGGPSPGEFRYRGRTLRFEHILPPDLRWHNILPRFRDVVRDYVEERGIPLHRYFHHLNSSQALALNLFVPFFESSELPAQALLRAMVGDGSLLHWSPEAVPDRREGTNFDAVWETVDGHCYLCEVKLSEGEFGRARPGGRHLEKLNHTYRPILEHHIAAEVLEPDQFFESYQLLRCLWHLVQDRRRRLVILMPRANVGLWGILKRTLSRADEQTRSRVSALALEDVFRALIEDRDCPDEYRTYTRELQEKYLPGAKP